MIGPEASEATARWKPLSPRNGAWRVSCGVAGCAGNLGVAVKPPDGAHRTPRVRPGRQTHRVAVDVPRGAWFLEHPNGYRRIGDGVFGVRRDERKRALDGTEVGRRPLPGPLRAALRLGDGTRQVVGHIPLLPCAVACPDCGRRNRVEPPLGESR